MRSDIAVSRNYAIAFLNSFQKDISVESLLKIREVSEFWRQNKKLFYFLDIPNFDNEKKIGVLKTFLDKFSAPSSLKDLIFLIVRHNRVSLIQSVLEKVCSLYMQRENILFFNIFSSHKLLDDELKSIQKFLSHKTGKTVLYDWSIDKNLIAGIRCQSETLVWEYSVSKQLNDLRRQLILQGAI